jgi:hypothetical protein
MGSICGKNQRSKISCYCPFKFLQQIKIANTAKALSSSFVYKRGIGIGFSSCKWIISVSLPPGWVQEIKGKYPALLMHGHSFTITPPLAPHCPSPLVLVTPSYPTTFLLTWRTSFSCSWYEYPSTLVTGLLLFAITVEGGPRK